MTLEIRASLRRPGPGGFGLEVDCRLPSRGVTAIHGPSGGGKSTLLRCVAGLEKSATGRIALDGEIWQDADRFVAAHRRGAALVFQGGVLFDHLSVRANLGYGSRRAAGGVPDFAEIVRLLGLAPLLHRRPADLSGGERQRVALGRALLAGPRLLLLDEPLAALDRPARRAIYPYLERVSAETGVPTLHVTHDLDEAARLADHLVLLEGGRVTGHGPLAAMLADLDGPLSRGPDGGAVLEATVDGHEPQHHLARLVFPGGELLVPIPDLEPGRRVRVRVHARDVSLALERPDGSSILNILPARVDGVAARRPGRMMVRLAVGGTALLAAVTERSAAQLALEPGRELFAQIKSVALL